MTGRLELQQETLVSPSVSLHTPHLHPSGCQGELAPAQQTDTPALPLLAFLQKGSCHGLNVLTFTECQRSSACRLRPQCDVQVKPPQSSCEDQRKTFLSVFSPCEASLDSFTRTL